MTGLAPDAVSIRRARARGVSDAALRRQFALVATPEVKRFVFVRRVRLRAAPHAIGAAMRTALTTLADGDRPEVLSYPDVPALVVGCAKAALHGGLGGWQWRMLGLSPVAGPGQAVAALLMQHPLEAGSAVAALAEAGVLASVWRQMPPAAARELAHALIMATGSPVPSWPIDPSGPPPPSARALLETASAFWGPVLAPLPPSHPAVLVAAIMAALRWAPRVLRSANDPTWPALVSRLATHPDMPTTRQPEFAAPAIPADHGVARTERVAPAIADATTADQARGDRFATHWAGLLFLINALNRLDLETILAADADPPSGWHLLHALGTAHGMPEDDPLAEFLAGQSPQPDAPASRGLLSELMQRMEALYHPDGPWPLPLRQLGWLTATETHLDLSLGTTAVDLAVRLVGLDLNPGWVSWLGRVVRFHYDAVPTYGPTHGPTHGSTAIAHGGRIDGAPPSA